MEQQIGDRIAKERKRLNMRQSELAEKLMVSNRAISKWESNGGNPSIEFLPKLADLFGCTIDYLVRGKTYLDVDRFMEIGTFTIGLLQRYFKLGYSKAATLVDELLSKEYLTQEDYHYDYISDKLSVTKEYMIEYLINMRN